MLSLLFYLYERSELTPGRAGTGSRCLGPTTEEVQNQERPVQVYDSHPGKSFQINFSVSKIFWSNDVAAVFAETAGLPAEIHAANPVQQQGLPEAGGGQEIPHPVVAGAGTEAHLVTGREAAEFLQLHARHVDRHQEDGERFLLRRPVLHPARLRGAPDHRLQAAEGGREGGEANSAEEAAQHLRGMEHCPPEGTIHQL